MRCRADDRQRARTCPVHVARRAPEYGRQRSRQRRHTSHARDGPRRRRWRRRACAASRGRAIEAAPVQGRFSAMNVDVASARTAGANARPVSASSPLGTSSDSTGAPHSLPRDLRRVLGPARRVRRYRTVRRRPARGVRPADRRPSAAPLAASVACAVAASAGRRLGSPRNTVTTSKNCAARRRATTKPRAVVARSRQDDDRAPRRPPSRANAAAPRRALHQAGRRMARLHRPDSADRGIGAGMLTGQSYGVDDDSIGWGQGGQRRCSRSNSRGSRRSTRRPRATLATISALAAWTSSTTPVESAVRLSSSELSTFRFASRRPGDAHFQAGARARMLRSCRTVAAQELTGHAEKDQGSAHHIRHRDSSIPSRTTTTSRTSWYAMDICLKIVDAVSRVKMPNLKVVESVTSATRIPREATHRDLECARRRTVSIGRRVGFTTRHFVTANLTWPRSVDTDAE